MWHIDDLNKLAELKGEGYTLDEIGMEYGVSRERVRQLLQRVGADTSRQLIPKTHCAKCNKVISPDSYYCKDCSHKVQAAASREWLIEEMRAWEKQYGRPPAVEDWKRNKDWPSITVVQSRFGSWNKGLKAAGFKPRKPGSK